MSQYEKALKLKDKANELFKGADFEAAIRQYTAAINELRNIDITDERDFERVISDTTEALLLDDKHVKSLTRRGMAYEGLEKWKKARDDFKRVRELNPGLTVALQGLNRAEANIRAEQRYAQEEASGASSGSSSAPRQQQASGKSQAKTSPAHTPTIDTEAMAQKAAEAKAKGNEAFKNGNHSVAVQWYGMAIQNDPKNHVLYSNRAAALTSMGNGLEAIVDADYCIDLVKDWPKGHYRKAMALISLNRHSEALQALRTCFRLDSTNMDVFNLIQQEEKLVGR